jgi:hypothetical protein
MVFMLNKMDFGWSVQELADRAGGCGDISSCIKPKVRFFSYKVVV